MAAAQVIGTVEPDSIIAGDSATWKRTISNYPATDGWALNYRLVFKQDGTALAVFSSTASGSDYLISLLAATTAGWSPGIYSASGYLTSGLLRVTIFNGSITVLPNFTSPANLGDTRSHAAKMVAACEALLEGRSADDILDSMVEGVSIRRLPVEQLILLRDRARTEYLNELAGEKIAKGLGTGRTILTRFVRSS